MYGVPIVVSKEAECGIVGCAAMAQTATGRHHDLDAAAWALVRTAAEVRADPAWRDRYADMQPVFDRLYRRSKPLYDDLDRLGD